MGKYEDNYSQIMWNKRKARIRAIRLKDNAPSFYVVKDIEPFVSPIDKSVVSSRSGLREHEKKHNVRQIGNDWSGSSKPTNWENMTNGRK